MNRLRRLAAPTLTLLLGLGSPAHAGLPEARAAFEKYDMATALREYEAAAKAGNAEAQLELAKLYLNGRYAPRDFARAYALFGQAAQQKHPEATYWTGIIQGTPQDGGGANPYYNLDQALTTLRTAAELGSREAMNELFNLYTGQFMSYLPATSATGALKSPTTALALAEGWARAGSTGGMSLYIEALGGQAGLSPNPSERTRWLKKLAEVIPKTDDEEGDVLRALMALAPIQRQLGAGSDANASYLRAAELGATEAKYRVGQALYDATYGPDSDSAIASLEKPKVSEVQAMNWLTEVMNAGDDRFSVKAATLVAQFQQRSRKPAEAQLALTFGLGLRASDPRDLTELKFQLGEVLLLRDAGVKRDPKKAYELLAEAAEQGQGRANARMAWYHLIGDRDLKNAENFTLARRYAETASNAGNGLGTMLLAVMYEEGWGVSRNLALALDLYLRALPLMEKDDWEFSKSLIKETRESLQRLQKALGK